MPSRVSFFHKYLLVKHWPAPAQKGVVGHVFIRDIAQATAGSPDVVRGTDGDDGDVFRVEVAHAGHVCAEFCSIDSGHRQADVLGGFAQPGGTFVPGFLMPVGYVFSQDSPANGIG